jgi:alkylation response protein AidB-like acyl-CoA dehydrogenase
VNLRFSQAEERFRVEVRSWLEAELSGDFSDVRGRGGPGHEDELWERRLAWERRLDAAGWTGLGWPKEYGGREATLHEQVIFREEYARARAPGRLSHIGEELLGPTLIHFASDTLKARFLPGIVNVSELWCQGYSEPGAGSDLAAVATEAVLDEEAGQWVLTGQKVWTSLAERAHFAFVLCRTDPTAPKHKGLSYLLVAMDQPGVEIRPIRQMTGGTEFAEVFFDGAVTPADHIVGAPGDGWKVALGTLSFERGVSTLSQQLSFEGELAEVTRLARERGLDTDPVIRDRLADAWIGLDVMRWNSLRMLSELSSGELSGPALINKLYWATWHRDLGDLALDVLGEDGLVADEGPYELSTVQRMALFSRSSTIYAGTNEIQKNIIAQRGLRLPRGPR